jgi:hypothetical protein
MYVCIHTQNACQSSLEFASEFCLGNLLCVYIYRYVYVCIYIYIYACMYLCLYAWVKFAFFKAASPRVFNFNQGTRGCNCLLTNKSFTYVWYVCTLNVLRDGSVCGCKLTCIMCANACMYVYMYVCICICIYIYIYIYINIHTFICTHTQQASGLSHARDIATSSQPISIVSTIPEAHSPHAIASLHQPSLWQISSSPAATLIIIMVRRGISRAFTHAASHA